MALNVLRIALAAAALGFSILWATPLQASSAATASAQTSEPDVTFQVLADRDTANRYDCIGLVFLVTNRSELSLDNVQLVLEPNDSVNLKPLPAIGAIPAFGSQVVENCALISANSSFQNHRAVFLLHYSWSASGVQHVSTQSATWSVQVERQFEDEAKGLPGGTAALLYLILPVMILFLAYQIVDSLRVGKLEIPEFKSTYIAPAFLGAILFNLLIMHDWQNDQGFLYGTPQGLARSILLLVLAGAAIPLVRWFVGLCFYTFREKDSKQKYLAKALHGNHIGEVSWTKATIAGIEWEGALLTQPNGAKGFGARLAVSPADPGGPSAEDLKTVIDERGIIFDKAKLMDYIRTGKLKLGFEERIKQSGKPIDGLFVECKSTELANESAIRKQIVRLGS
jgi:hypothetical protein